MTSPLLQVNGLNVNVIDEHKNSYHLIKDLSFSLDSGEIVGLVGESGCGKSLTASALLALLPSSFRVSGEIFFEQKNLLTMTSKELSFFRGSRMSLILQDPNLALNPLIKIGHQLIEGLCYHKKIPQRQAIEKGIQWLNRVGIGDARYRMNQYPHEISGGMKQRIMIAMALICQPSLLIADEPTTALDVTVQAQILDLLQKLQQEEKIGILLITHDLSVVAQYCSRVLVMYAGQIIEQGHVEKVFSTPHHHYTQTLLQCRLNLAEGHKQ